jgi:hypothetical protein
MFNELIKGVLVVVVAFALKAFLAAVAVEIDEVLFNTLVAGIVVWIMTALGLEGLRAIAPRFFK